MKLAFKSTRDEMPKNGQSILYIKDRKSIYSHSFEPTFTNVEWQWHDGGGTSVFHDDKFTLENRPEGYPYFTMVDDNGYEIYSDYFPDHWKDGDKIIEHFWWIDEDEYYNQLNSKIP